MSNITNQIWEENKAQRVKDTLQDLQDYFQELKNEMFDIELKVAGLRNQINLVEKTAKDLWVLVAESPESKEEENYE